MRPFAAFLLLTALAAPAAAAEPVLEDVLLSTGGVGYLGFRADAGEVRLRVPLRQVDDLLKSLTIQGGGTVRAVNLPGPTPVADPFRETPFRPGDLDGLPQLLARLQGAEVVVEGSTALQGRVLAVAPEETVVGEARTLRHRLSLLTATGIRSVLLENLETLHLADPQLQERLDRLLADLADRQLEAAREVVVELDGGPARLGYLAEMPVWKATYRLVAGEGDGLLQGWAVLENLSGQDWAEVAVTLIAGSPTALRQALYRSYFVPRPELPVLPVPEEKAPAAVAAARFADAAPAPAPALEAAGAEELTAQTLYRLPRPVSLRQGRTVMAPLVDRAVPVTRLARYRAGEDDRHPKAALRVRNTEATSLPGGIATLYERPAAGGLTFLGDAALPPLAPGEAATLAYGRDGNIEIDRREDGARRIERASVVDGVLELRRAERLAATYRIEARFAGAPRELAVEQELPPGWRVAEPADAAVEDGIVRASRALAAGSTSELAIVTERPEVERVVLVDADVERLLVETAGEAPPELRAALAQLGRLGAALADSERRIAAVEARRAERVAEQERLRANLEAVPEGGDLARRYLDRLGTSEDEIAAFDRELDGLRRERDAAGEARRTYLRTLRL